MRRILLILVLVAAINALAWCASYYDAATDMSRGSWSPVARAAVSRAGQVSRKILKPFFWLGGSSRPLAIAGVIALEATVIAVAARAVVRIANLQRRSGPKY